MGEGKGFKFGVGLLVVIVLIRLGLGAGFFEKIAPRLFGQKVAPGVTVEGISVAGLRGGEVEKIIGRLAGEAFVRPRNAYLDPWSQEVVPETSGTLADIQSTLQRVMEAPPGSRVLLDRVELDPEITTALFEQINQRIGFYYTIYGGGGGRNTNIELAAVAINNYLLFPGELFSFNRAVGPRTVERGYELAPIIVGGSVVPGLGGGICQVSSTLYNSVLEAGLEVVERYPHSMPIGYVPPGRDATVSDYLDFKFRNSTDLILLIKTACWGGRIEVEILSQAREEPDNEQQPSNG